MSRPINAETNFRNEASKRFHQFFVTQVHDKKLDWNQLAVAFGKTKQGIYTLFNNLRAGHQGVTIEQIELAKKEFGLNPAFLFGESLSQNIENVKGFEEAELQYIISADLNRHIGRQLHDILKKHGTNIRQYAKDKLGMTEQNLHKIFRGEGRAYWDTVVTVCEDHGESLDVFRRTPVPKGHYLAQIKIQENLINELQARIKQLEAKPGSKRASA